MNQLGLGELLKPIFDYNLREFVHNESIFDYEMLKEGTFCYTGLSLIKLPQK